MAEVCGGLGNAPTRPGRMYFSHCNHVRGRHVTPARGRERSIPRRGGHDPWRSIKSLAMMMARKSVVDSGCWRNRRCTLAAAAAAWPARCAIEEEYVLDDPPCPMHYECAESSGTDLVHSALTCPCTWSGREWHPSLSRGCGRLACGPTRCE